MEYVDNIEDVVKELYRVSGGPQNLFIVTVKNYSYAAYFYKEDNYSSKYIIKAPPNTNLSLGLLSKYLPKKIDSFA